MADSVHISGAGNVGGGEYKNISISGSGEVTSDVKCQSLKSAGSVHIAGSVECSGEFKIAGSVLVDGDIKCGSCHLAGSAKVKSIEANGELWFAGSVIADGNISGEKVIIDGVANVNGLINGDEIRIAFDGDGVKTNEIGGGTIKIAPKKRKESTLVQQKENKAFRNRHYRGRRDKT
ncbi:MAG: polymer-forming cytoskeletal protein [Ruminococcus sp.]|nr:polymer-forming cytoskeletal protein [Ruminococcus sp.]